MRIDIGTAIGIAGVLAAIVFGYLAWKRTAKRDSYIEGGNRGAMQADITYIKRRTDDTLLEAKETNKSLNALSERVTRVEESSKQAHKRIDSLELEIRDK